MAPVAADRISVDAAFTVLGVGLSSSLGGARQACAAARARLTRPRLIGDPPRFDHEGNPDPVTVHLVDEVGEGFQGTGRLVVLAQRAAADLRCRAPALQGRIGLFLVTADDRGLEEAAGGDPADGLPPVDREALAHGLVQALGVPVGSVEHIALGSSGCTAALARAGAMLADGRIDLAILGAVDSLVDHASLRWLTAVDRLKGVRRTDGLVPGEAAVLVALGRRGDGGDVFRFLGEAELEPPRPAWRAPQAPRPDCVRTALANVATETPLWLFPDINGERFRFAQLGAVSTLLARQGRRVVAEDAPAAAFGDTGACAAMLALLLVLHGHARGNARAGTGLIICASDTGGCMALVVQRAEGGPP